MALTILYNLKVIPKLVTIGSKFKGFRSETERQKSIFYWSFFFMMINTLLMPMKGLPNAK